MKWKITLFLLLTLGSQCSLGALWSYGRSAFGFPEAPMSFFSKVTARAKDEGRPLRNYDQAPQNHKLQTNIERVSKLGQPLALKCSSKLAMESCTWTSPSGQTFNMKELPLGYTSVIDNDKTCHLMINNLSEEQLGKWSCTVKQKGQNQYQQAFMTATEVLPVTDVRLPIHIVPETYVIHLTPFIIQGNYTIEGHVNIKIKSTQKANNITLHIKDIQIYENLVSLTDLKEDKQIEILGHAYDEDREFYIIKADIEADHEYTIDINYQADLNDDLAGFYRSSYFDSIANETKVIGTSQMEATDARRALPCFDEPQMKAKFQVNLGRLESMTSISNMPPTASGVAMPDQDQYVWDQYEESLQMSTYLLAFVVSDFEYRSGLDLGTQFRIWSRKEAIDETQYAAEIGPKILKYYETFFNIPFPLPKQDMIAIPDFSAGAMENWGLITYRETALLHNPQMDSASRRIYVSTVVAHELAHQWFGDLVTMKWWDDLWLNEGFASYIETIGAAHVEPTASILERFCLDNTYDTFDLDSLQTSHPISATVKHPDEINEIFDRISYGKGASIIRMMNHFMTEEAFVEGVSNYLNAYKYDNAEQDDLWSFLTDAAHAKGTLDPDLTVKEIMDTWTLQMGYPVLHVKTDLAKQTLEISQERYLSVDPDLKVRDDHDYQWWVPITFDYAGGQFNKTNNDHWLRPGQTSLNIDLDQVPDEAIIVNVQQTGYYRVNYDLENWQKIIEALVTKPNSINRINKGQIFNDLFSLAKVGMVPYNLTMESTKYLLVEKDYIPWASGLIGLGYVKSMFSRTGGYGLLKKYLSSEMVGQYRSLGFNMQKSDSIDDQSLRELIVSWMCSIGYHDCQRQSKDLFRAWMQSANPDQDNPIDPGVRGSVYCQAIKDGDEQEWNFLWQRLQRTSSANERNNIYKGLSCTQQVWILQRYLDLTLDPGSPIRKQDGSSVISRIASNPLGRFLTWNWLRNQWVDVSTYFDTAISSAVGRIIKSVTKDFNTPFELQELQAFYEEHQNELGTAKRTTLNSIEMVKANVQWMKKYYNDILDWLKLNVQDDF